MASLVLVDAFVSIGGNDLSSNVRQVTLDYSADAVEDTNMGDTTHIQLGGLKDWTLTVEFSQDFATGQLDGIMFPLVGTVVAIIVRPDAGVIGVSNPEYTGNVLVQGSPPLGNSVGELATTTVVMPSAGPLSRDES